MRHQLLLAFLSATFTTAASGNLQRHRILPEHKEVTSPPALTSDPLTPNAINADGDVCSCSPTKFTFRLILSQDCSTDDIATNVGIDSTFCTVDEIVSDAAPINDEPIRRLQSTTPVEITSVQFLEFASDSFDVIYTDDSYIDTSLVGGDTVTFYSSSSYLPTVSKEDQEKYVPGGVSLILTGNTEDGSQIRNRFYWLYDEVVTDCLENLSTPGIYEGDAIGWISTESVSGPWPQFCPAESPSSPTIYPRTLSPSSTPSLSPSSFSYGLPTQSKSGKISSSKSNKDYVSKSSKNVSSAKSDKIGIDAKATMNSDYSGKSSKSSISDHSSGSMSMQLTESPSSSPSDSMSYRSTSVSHSSSAKSGKSVYDSKTGKNDYRVFSSKSSKSSNEKAFSKSGKSSGYSSKSMSFSMSTPSTATPESISHNFTTTYANQIAKSSKAEVDTKAEKYSSKSSKNSGTVYRNTSTKSEKTHATSSKSAKSVHLSDDMSYSLSMPSAAPSESVAPIDDSAADTKAGKYSAKAYRLMKPKSGKGQSQSSSMKVSRKMMSEKKAKDLKSASTKSSKSEILMSKSSKGSTSMSYSEHSLSYQSTYSSKSAKSSETDLNSKSSKSSIHFSEMNSSKSSKGFSEEISSKSRKGTSNYSDSMSYSAFPSMAPSESATLKSSAHLNSSSKSSKEEVDAKAEKYSSKSSKNSTATYRHHSTKSSKGSMPSTKSGKSGHTDIMSYSMSMPSAAPSESVAPIDDSAADTKAGKHSAKAYRLMKPKSGKGQSQSSSKASKGSTVEESMSYSVPSTSISSSSAPTSSGKSSKGSIAVAELSSKSSKSYHVVDMSSMSYSMSMREEHAHEQSSKSSKGESHAKHLLVRGLSKIDPDDEEAWAEYALLDAISASKSSKIIPSHQSLSMQTSSQTSSKSLKEDHLVLSGKNNKSMSIVSEVIFSKSSKSDESLLSKSLKAIDVEQTSSKSSKADGRSSKSSKGAQHNLVFTGSKSSKGNESYTLSSDTQEQDDSSPKKEPGSNTSSSTTSKSQSSSSSIIDTGIESEEKEPSPNQIRSTNSSPSRSLVTAFVLLILQIMI